MKISIFTKHKAIYITLLYFLLFSFACSSAPSVTATYMPGVTVTSTPSVTYTPVPTTTVEPSSTPLPSATPTPLVPDFGRVIFSENFNDLEFPFNVWGPLRIESGALVVEREAGYKSPDGIWPFGGIYGTFPVPPDRTTLVLFKATGGTTYNIGYHIGDYGTESLLRFSFNSGQGRWDLYKGSEANPIQHWDARHPRSDTWHYFSITRTASGDMDAKLWERDKPETVIKFHGNLGSEWGLLEFTFFIDYRSGSFMLDEYQDLQ